MDNTKELNGGISSCALLSWALTGTLHPPLAVRACQPNQVQCRTQMITLRACILLSRAFGHCLFASPGNSHSRGFQPLLAIPDAPPAFIRHRRRQATVPLGAAMASPNQVQCCTLAAYGPGAHPTLSGVDSHASSARELVGDGTQGGCQAGGHPA